MQTQDEKSSRSRLSGIVVLLLAIAIIACSVMLLRSCGPSAVVLAQRNADQDTWEKSQTIEQQREADAWKEAVREYRRGQGLIALVFLLGNITIVVTFIRSTIASKRDMNTLTIKPEAAFSRVFRSGARALGTAFVIMITVPIIESVVTDGHGMYFGERGISALVTAFSFLFFWALSWGLAFVALQKNCKEHF